MYIHYLYIHSLFPKLFIPLNGNLVSTKQYLLSPSISPSLKSLVTFNLLSTPTNLVILMFHRSEIIQYLSFCVWLFHLACFPVSSVLAPVRIPLLFIAEKYFTVYAYHILSIHSFVDWPLSSFSLWATMNSTVLNTGIRYLCPCF